MAEALAFLKHCWKKIGRPLVRIGLGGSSPHH
jgi:hypothetical protein